MLFADHSAPVVQRCGSASRCGFGRASAYNNHLGLRKPRHRRRH
jgi:hypothetical protein